MARTIIEFATTIRPTGAAAHVATFRVLIVNEEIHTVREGQSARPCATAWQSTASPMGDSEWSQIVGFGMRNCFPALLQEGAVLGMAIDHVIGLAISGQHPKRVTERPDGTRFIDLGII